MNFVFLMDPLGQIIFEKDTSFVLMREAASRAHNVFYLPNTGITHRQGELFFRAQRVAPQNNKSAPFAVEGWEQLKSSEIDALFIRTDPPFNYRYLMNTWLLGSKEDQVAIINRPSGIRSANEKIWATQFVDLIPPTLVSSQKDNLLKFVATHKHVIAKPTDGYGGQSVFSIGADDKNAKALLETMTNNEKRAIVLQKFIPESDRGDKRILLLDGEPLGAVLRVHAKDDHRNNFFSGGKPEATTITARDKEIISALKPELKRMGLYFVGIDVIGDYLIEINVTSPTCLQEMNRLYDETLEAKVISFAEGLVNNK